MFNKEMIKEGTGKELLKISSNENDFASVEIEQKNWKGISIALAVIFIMCLIIILCVLFLTPFSKSTKELRSPVEISDILEYNLVPLVDGLEWLENNNLLVKTYDNNITSIDMNNVPFTSKTFLNDEIKNRYSYLEKIYPGKDDQLFVVAKNIFNQRIMKIIDPVVGKYINLDENLEEVVGKVSFVWGPKKNQFAVVNGSDIFVKIPGKLHTFKITNTSENESQYIYNGITDWMYFEEIFQKNEAMWWSKSGKYLAFLTLNDTNVYRQNIPIFQKKIHPLMDKVFYPKVSDKYLPIPTLNIWSLNDSISQKINVLLKNNDLTTYLYSASWHTFYDKEYLIAVWANRIQNIITVTICSYNEKTCIQNFQQKYIIDKRRLNAETSEWQIRHSTNDAYFVILPQKNKNGNIYSQVAKIIVNPTLTNSHEIFLHQGTYDVSEILYVDKKKNILYFVAAAPDPKQQHIYSISILTNISSITNIAQCITCNIFPDCTYQEGGISPNGKNIYIHCRGLGIPRTFIAKIDKIKNYSIPIQDTNIMKNIYNSKKLPKIVYDEIVLPKGNKAFIEMLVPEGYSLDSKIDKLPVIVDVYGGPGVQKVTENILNLLSMNMVFASMRKYVVIFIDGRGSMNRGWNMKEPRYGKFGTVEVEDTIDATKFLIKKYSLLDSTKVGIWGWSYGGFLTAKVIQKDNDNIFSCGCSVAPVTNFFYYDAAYTERYMGLENNKGYAETDLTQVSLSNFKNKKYLVVHGSADDNVHLQNTMNFVANLVSQNIDFDMMIYPDDQHGILNGKKHLFNKLDNFFNKCFFKNNNT
uniref:Dipeptidyl aminopeptidase-like protein 6 n=1 Tax=Strongyloides stercoralis TaxID=6248 RepID=A0A0K0DWU2_STRER